MIEYDRRPEACMQALATSKLRFAATGLLGPIIFPVWPWLAGEHPQTQCGRELEAYIWHLHSSPVPRNESMLVAELLAWLQV